MSNKIQLSNAVNYSSKRIDAQKVLLENFITTDNLLPSKGGIKIASNLPPSHSAMPAYCANNILISNIRPYLKKIWYSNRDGGCNADVLVFDVKQTFCPKFIYYTMFSDDFFEHVMKGAKGTKMPRGDKQQILEYLIPNFNLPTQQRIAHILSTLDAKIELNNRINAQLEAMAKTIYDYWFVQFDFPDANGKPYKSSGGKMVWNEELKREVPKGWEVETLGDNVECILDHRGKTPLKLGGDWVFNDDGIIALSAKHVKDGKLLKLNEANRVSFEMYNKWMPEKLKHGDIIMTSEAPLGEFYFILNDVKYCMSQRLFAIRANSLKIYPTYLYFELSKGNGYSQIIGKQSGSTVFGIRQNELKEVLIIKPILEIQKSFNEYIKPMLMKIRINEQQNQQLSSLRDWLLPMLMNGQVSVRE